MVRFCVDWKIWFISDTGSLADISLHLSYRIHSNSNRLYVWMISPVSKINKNIIDLWELESTVTNKNALPPQLIRSVDRWPFRNIHIRSKSTDGVKTSITSEQHYWLCVYSKFQIHTILLLIFVVYSLITFSCRVCVCCGIWQAYTAPKYSHNMMMFFFFYFSRIWCACERDALMVKTKTNLFYIRKMVVCSAIVKKKTVPTSTFDRLMVCVESGRGENARTCAPMHCASIVY